MRISEKLIGFLKEKNVSYEVLTHPEAFTAQQVAHVIHQSGKLLAKTVVINSDGKHVMIVVPAHHKVKLDSLKSFLGAKEVRLAPEETLRGLFADCDLGAMPPIGPLYDMEVIVSEALSVKQDMIFNAGTHTDCIKMHYADFERLVQPTVADISDIPTEAK